jgi:hypothetical protein
MMKQCVVGNIEAVKKKAYYVVFTNLPPYILFVASVSWRLRLVANRELNMRSSPVHRHMHCDV